MMKYHVSNDAGTQLDKLVAQFEKQTKTEIVLAVTQKSDSYDELPWKAFALGASLAGIGVFVQQLFFNGWDSLLNTFQAVTGILGCGVLFAVLVMLFPFFARFFLSKDRAATEVEQYAASMFLKRELFATRSRIGILALVSLFERKIVIQPDIGLRTILTSEALQPVIEAMIPLLKRGEIVPAFEQGLEQLTSLIGTSSPGSHGNELSDEIIEEKGE
ncbi:MAG: TPM domain-containing protein [Pseudomonadota bacterium]